MPILPGITVEPPIQYKEVYMIQEIRTDDLEVCKKKIREYRKFLFPRPYTIHLQRNGDVEVSRLL